MSYESILEALSACGEWFFNNITLFLSYIKNTPLLSAALIIIIGLPAVLILIEFIASFSSGARLFMNENKYQINTNTKNSYIKINKSKNDFIRDSVKVRRENKSDN